MSQRNISRRRPRPIAWAIGIALALVSTWLTVQPAQATLQPLTKLATLSNTMTCVSSSQTGTIIAYGVIGSGSSADVAPLDQYPVEVDGGSVQAKPVDREGGSYLLDGLASGPHSLTVPGYYSGSWAFNVAPCASPTVAQSNITPSTSKGDGKAVLRLQAHYFAEESFITKLNGVVQSSINFSLPSSQTVGPYNDLEFDGLAAGPYTVHLDGNKGNTFETTFVVPLSGPPAGVPSIELQEAGRTPSTVLGNVGDGSITVQLTVGKETDESVDFLLYAGQNPTNKKAVTVHTGDVEEVSIDKLGASVSDLYVYVEYLGQQQSFTFDPIEIKDIKPTVDCPELTKIVGNVPDTVKCAIRHNGKVGETFSPKLSKNGGAAKSLAHVSLNPGRSATISLSLTVANYRLSVTNGAGTAYDDFRVIKFPSPSVQRDGKQRYANFKVKAPYAAKVGYQKYLGHGRWSSVHWANKGHVVGANKTVKVNAPNPRKHHSVTDRIVVDKVGAGYWTSKSIKSRR